MMSVEKYLYCVFVKLDKTFGFCILLGRKRYHGSCKFRMDSAIAFRISRFKISIYGYGLHARYIFYLFTNFYLIIKY